MGNELVRGYYNSKYYTGEEIDQRLLQNYYDDAVQSGFVGSKEAFLRSLASLKIYNFKYIQAPVGYDGTWGKFNSPSVAAEALNRYFGIITDLGTKVLFYDSSSNDEFIEYTASTDSNGNVRWVRNLKPEEFDQIVSNAINTVNLGIFHTYEGLIAEAISPVYSGNLESLILYGTLNKDGGEYVVQIHQVSISPVKVEQNIYYGGDIYTRSITFSDNTHSSVSSVTEPVKRLTAEKALAEAISELTISRSELENRIGHDKGELLNDISQANTRIDEINSRLNTSIEDVTGLSNTVATEIAQRKSEDIDIRNNINSVQLDLQGQIDDIVSGGASINISISPSVVYTNNGTDVTITGTSDIDAETLSIKVGDTELSTGQGKRLQYVDTEIPDSVSGTRQYIFEANIRGSVRTKTGNLSMVDRIYYGAGNSYEDVTSYPQSPKTSPAGTYNITVNSSSSPFFIFNIPNTMNIKRVTMNGYDVPMASPVEVMINSVKYKSYKSMNEYVVGTYTLVVE